MEIIITLNSTEVLDRVSKEDIKKYITEKWEIEDIEEIISENRKADEIWELLERSVDSIEKFIFNNLPARTILNEIPEEDIIEHLRENSEYFIGEDVDSLMEQVYNAGLIDEVSSMFEIRYYKD